MPGLHRPHPSATSILSTPSAPARPHTAHCQSSRHQRARDASHTANMSFGTGGGFGGFGSNNNQSTGFGFGANNNNNSGGKCCTLLDFRTTASRGYVDNARQCDSRRGLLVESSLTRPSPQALARTPATLSVPTTAPAAVAVCSVVTHRAHSAAEVRDLLCALRSRPDFGFLSCCTCYQKLGLLPHVHPAPWTSLANRQVQCLH